jgi:hypothetical protein
MRIRKADDNQPRLVEQLRKIPGVTVAHTHTIGKGFPDLVVGWRGKTYLLEIKDPAKPKSARKLTPDEEQWHQKWTGHVSVVETVEDVLRILCPSTSTEQK